MAILAPPTTFQEATKNSFLQVNQHSTIGNQIEFIRHDVNQSLIHVEMKPNARCKRPVFRGRLSGPALVMLEWSRHSITTLYGHYSVPLSGMYFVEIIALLCEEFHPRQNFTQACLEDPLKHRVTTNGAAIEVKHDASVKAESGYWINRNSENAYEPLYTRFQPQHCRLNDTRVNSSYCQDPMNVNRFDDYEWSTDIDYSYLQDTHNNNTTICLIGASHSGVLYRYMLNVTSTPVFVETARFPDENATIAVEAVISKYNCTMLVIGMGQWSAGWPDKRPALFQEFAHDMHWFLNWIRKTFAKIPIFVRSLHYNPIGDIIGSCPPHDWRSPPVIDGYNQVLKRLSTRKSLRVSSFIDTNHIIAPMWDSAPDWCHFRNRAGQQEARYIAWYLLANDNCRSIV